MLVPFFVFMRPPLDRKEMREGLLQVQGGQIRAEHRIDFNTDLVAAVEEIPLEFVALPLEVVDVRVHSRYPRCTRQAAFGS